jgi:hypothetical protein
MAPVVEYSGFGLGFRKSGWTLVSLFPHRGTVPVSCAREIGVGQPQVRPAEEIHPACFRPFFSCGWGRCGGQVPFPFPPCFSAFWLSRLWRAGLAASRVPRHRPGPGAAGAIARGSSVRRRTRTIRPPCGRTSGREAEARVCLRPSAIHKGKNFCFALVTRGAGCRITGRLRDVSRMRWMIH